MAERRIEADTSVCVGTGQCEMTLPEVFMVGDEGVVELDSDAAAKADQAKLDRAVRNCPTGALSWVED